MIWRLWQMLASTSCRTFFSCCSKTRVKDLSDLLKERYLINARGFSVQSFERFCVENRVHQIKKRLRSGRNIR